MKSIFLNIFIYIILTSFFAINASTELAEKDYSTIDAHALNTPENALRSIQTLADYLIGPASSDDEKLRAIFRWITHNISYDTEGYFSGRYGDLSADGVLKSGRAVCEGYSGLFKGLADAAGLTVVKVTGYSKGYGYSVGNRIRPGQSNHAWNAARLNGKWYLLDPTWGAGYVTGGGEFVRRFQEYYYLTPPDKFIYDHFPEDSRWQLLSNPITLRDYESLVYLRPTFFINNLSIISHRQNTIRSDGLVKIVVGAPDDVLLSAALEQNRRRLQGDYTFIQREGDHYAIFATFPAAGDYKLQIFSKHNNDPGSYAWALEYLVNAGASSTSLREFPTSYGMFSEKNAYLHSPLQKNLPRGSTQTFKIEAPNALEVAVVIDKQWYELMLEDNMFFGEIPITGREITVFAKYKSGSNYQALLGYRGN